MDHSFHYHNYVNIGDWNDFIYNGFVSSFNSANSPSGSSKTWCFGICILIGYIRGSNYSFAGQTAWFQSNDTMTIKSRLSVGAGWTNWYTH